METAVILLNCPDHSGIVAKITECIHKHNGNIIRTEQHITSTDTPWFFMRFEFNYNKQNTDMKKLEKSFTSIATGLNAEWNIFYKDKTLKMGILVSAYDHCLVEVLYRYKNKDLNIEIPFVISNHTKLEKLVSSFEIPFIYIPVEKNNKEKAEKAILEKVCDNSDFLGLARYMQILSGNFLKSYGKDIINIHHSFLPSFKGADPYTQAYKRGVKLIGATSHFVTKEIDEGPIISQRVERISSKDQISDYKRKGKNIEKLTFASAIRLYSEHKIIKFMNKTIIFE